MRILVIAEHDHDSLKPATRHTLSAARQLGDDIEVLVAGNQCAPAAQAVAQVSGVRQVSVVDSPLYAEQDVENLAALLVEHIRHSGHRHVLAPATTFGKNLLPRVAALLDVAQIADVVSIIDARTFVRPIYAGNALATVQSDDPILALTVRATAFAPAEDASAPAAVVELAAGPAVGRGRLLGRELTRSSRPALDSARVIVSGGRGLGSAEQYQQQLAPLADKLNAALGASRAAVDAGFAANDSQVGQTGKIVAPELYFAIGISGAIQHLAGMKDSKIIVAINKDEEAPIFQVADYGLVADLFDAVPQLTAAL